MTAARRRRNNIMTPERITIFLMKQIVRVSMLMMIAGIILRALNINPAPADTPLSLDFVKISLRAPNSTFFFGAATALLLLTPVIVSLCAGAAFAVKKQFKTAAISFLLFAILTGSIAVQILAA